MKYSKRKDVARTLIGVLIGAAAVLCVTVPFKARGDNPGGRDKVLTSQPLADIPNQQLTAVLVSYAPGGKSPVHHHAGSVFAYVVSGSIRSQSSATGPAQVYQTGDSFFEPAGSTHLVSENASATEPARLLAVFVAPANARLTTSGPASN